MRRSLFVYVLLAAIWALVVVWQAEEHFRMREAAKTDLSNRSKDIANSVSACIRGMRFRGNTVMQERLEPVLDELVNGRSNELVKASELISIALLNAAGEPVASAGRPIDFGQQNEILQHGERWGQHSVTFVNPVDLGASLTAEGGTNPTVVLPPMRGFTNLPLSVGRGEGRGEGFPNSQSFREGARDLPRREPPPPGERVGPETLDSSSTNHAFAPPPPSNASTLEHSERGGHSSSSLAPSDGERDGVRGSPNSLSPSDGERAGVRGRSREGESRPRRPPWLRGMTEQDYQSLLEKRSLHGLVLAMSTETFQAAATRDLWLRLMIILLASISAVGSGLAWRNLTRSSELEIRLVRASELNTHLKEMNLAAAGLAHETRNPLNIIRGLAQMISKQPEAAPEVRQKSRDIVNEVDKVAAQLNEFINYSRPREVRRSLLALGSVVNEVARALSYDLEEKQIQIQLQGEQLTIEADEQLLRQALFNLLLNAIQAVQTGGQIQVAARKFSATEAHLEVRDNGPGVPPDRRTEIFKPYFTTQKTGTGLGLAVVQQIVLAHGWEIECLANEPRGALFRISHLKLA